MRQVTADTIARRPHAGISQLERALVVLALVFIFNTLRAVTFGSGGEDSDGDRTAGNLAFQLTALGIYGTGILILLARIPVWLPQFLIRCWPLFLLIGFAAVSAVWSDYPLASARRSVALLFTTAFAVYVVARLTVHEFLDLLAFAMLGYVAISFASVAVPDLGFHHDVHSGSLRGFTGHKNDLGKTAALICVVAVVMRGQSPFMARIHVPLALGAFVMLLMSKSATSLITALATIALVPVFRFALTGISGRIRVSPPVRVLAAAVLLATAIPLFVFAVPYGLELVGKDLTLTGRTKLWAYAAELGSNRPWFGAGYRAFWTDANTFFFSEFFHWGDKDNPLYKGPGNGHNGYLDIWLELGSVGVTLYAALTISALRCASRLFIAQREAEGWLLLAMIIFMAVYSITEKVILQQTEGVWFLFLVSYLYGMAPSRSWRSTSRQ